MCNSFLHITKLLFSFTFRSFLNYTITCISEIFSHHIRLIGCNWVSLRAIFDLLTKELEPHTLRSNDFPNSCLYTSHNPLSSSLLPLNWHLEFPILLPAKDLISRSGLSLRSLLTGRLRDQITIDKSRLDTFRVPRCTFIYEVGKE